MCDTVNYLIHLHSRGAQTCGRSLIACRWSYCVWICGFAWFNFVQLQCSFCRSSYTPSHASHTGVDFFNEVSLLYGTIIDFCTPESCPVMSAGRKYEYRWADGQKYRTPARVSAPKYVDLLMDWVEQQLSDEDIFPTSTGACASWSLR